MERALRRVLIRGLQRKLQRYQTPLDTLISPPQRNRYVYTL
jgi:hypothetical protein